MKKIIKSIYFVAAVFAMTSCLKEGDSNIPPDAKGSILEMFFVQHGGTTINSGLAYFGGGALTYPADHVADTATFVVAIQGANTLGSDLTVTLNVDPASVDDNAGNDGIDYDLMPDSLFHFISKTGVIKAGQSTATFQVIFYPNKVDPTKSYNLPVTATNSGNVPMSSNFGPIYFHVIGNPLAGTYNWDFTRYNNADGSGTPTAQSFTDEHAVFTPVDPTTIRVYAGYLGGAAVHFLIKFKNTNGVLSDFTAVWDPADVKSNFQDPGRATPIEVTSAPVITVNKEQTEFTIKSVVNAGSDYRNLTDRYYK